MLLAEVKSIADRKAGGKDALLVLAVPDHYTPERRAAAASAAAIGGFDPASVSVVAAAEAAVAGWALKHPQAAVAAEGEGGGDAEDASAAANGAARHVMIVDVGQSTAQATVFKVGRLTADGSPSFEQLNPANTTAVFGVADVDEFVFDNIASKLDSEYQVKVKPGTRRASRLLREAGKARKILSANELTEVVLECFDDRERDFQFKMSRADFDGETAHRSKRRAPRSSPTRWRPPGSLRTRWKPSSSSEAARGSNLYAKRLWTLLAKESCRKPSTALLQ